MHPTSAVLLRRGRWSVALVSLILGACGGGGGASPTTPAAPTIGQVTPGDRALALAFSPPVSDGGAPVSRYTATCRGGLFDSESVSGTASPITVGGLVNGREYSCSVTARNSVGEGPASATATAVPYTVPGPPMPISSTAGDGSVEIAFAAPGDDGGNRIIDYEMLCTGGGETRAVTGASSPLRISGLGNGTAYACTVSARNAAGKGRTSAPATVTPRTVPAAPVIASVSPDMNSLFVAFTSAGDGGAPIGSYTTTCTSATGGRSVGSTSSPAVVTGLPNDTVHSCTVRATNVAGEGPPSAAVPATPRDLSRQTQLAAAVDASGRRVTLSWRDVFPPGTTYRVESQPLAGGVPVQRALVAGAGNGGTLTWSVDIGESTSFRVVAVRAGLTDLPITTAQGVAAASVAFSPAPPAIIVDAAEPLSGTVRLRLSDGVVYPNVDWFVDLNRIDSVEGAVGGLVAWNTGSVANGDHLILARAQIATNSFIELRRTVRVGNVLLDVTTTDYGDGDLFLTAYANSSSGIASVDGSFAGTPLPRLTAPNCADCGAQSSAYRWVIDRTRYPSGAYPVVVTAVDRDGNRKTVERQVQVNNKPVLTLRSPQRNEIVQGKLFISGQASTDRPGVLRTTATLGGLTVLDTTALSFETSFDLAGLTPGPYILRLRSVDSAGVDRVITREVIVTASADRVYTAVLTLGDDSSIITTDGRSVLYQQQGVGRRLYSFSSASEVTLSDADKIQYAIGWQIVDGRVYAGGLGSDCTTRCVYQWDAGGARRNLSGASPFASVGGTRCVDEDPTVQGDFVIWANSLCGKGQYTVLDLASGSYRKIDPPAAAEYIGNTRFDITADGGAAFIWAQMGGNSFDVFRSSGGSSARLSTPGLRSVYPRTNGTRVVWEQSPVGGNPDNSVELISAPVAGGVPRSIARGVLSWRLTEQALVWIEAVARDSSGAVTATALRVEVGGNITTIPTQRSVSLYAATRSQVLYVEGGRFYRWDASQGVRTLLLEAEPQELYAKDGVVIFTFGPGRVYRLNVP